MSDRLFASCCLGTVLQHATWEPCPVAGLSDDEALAKAEEAERVHPCLDGCCVAPAGAWSTLLAGLRDEWLSLVPMAVLIAFAILI